MRALMIFFLFLLCYQLSFAQYDYPLPKKLHRNNRNYLPPKPLSKRTIDSNEFKWNYHQCRYGIISTNVFQYLNGDFALFYDLPLQEKLSLEVSVGLTNKPHLMLLGEKLGALAGYYSSGFEMNGLGWSASISVKQFLGKGGYFGRGIYASIGIIHQSYNGYYYSIESKSYNKYVHYDNPQWVGLRNTVGYQTIGKSKIVLGFHIGSNIYMERKDGYTGYDGRNGFVKKTESGWHFGASMAVGFKIGYLL